MTVFHYCRQLIYVTCALASHLHRITYPLIHDKVSQSPKERSLCFIQNPQVFGSWAADQLYHLFFPPLGMLRRVHQVVLDILVRYWPQVTENSTQLILNSELFFFKEQEIPKVRGFYHWFSGSQMSSVTPAFLVFLCHWV